ncbi:MAG: YHS domain-containing protein [bacterium]
MKKIIFWVVTGLFIFNWAIPCLAMDMSEDKQSNQHKHQPQIVKEAPEPVNADAKICPVLGTKIDSKTAVEHKYKGNTYVLCCPACIDEFNKAPAKYISISPPLSGILKEGVREIEVTASKFEFLPEPIGVKLGEKVRLKIRSPDVDHGIGIKEYGINKAVKRGTKEQVIEFTANKAGTFVINCTVFCGEGHGKMKSKLIVQEPAKK